MAELPPFLLFLIGAILVAFVRGVGRAVIQIAVPIVGLWWVWAYGPFGSTAPVEASTLTSSIAGLELELCRLDGLSAVFVGLFCVATLLATLFSLRVRDRLQVVAAPVYAGSAIGAVLAGDLLTVFVWVEVMAVSSALLIYARRTERARRAAFRYLIWQLASGMLILAGAIARVVATGTAEIGPLTLEDPGALWLLAGFGIKAGFPLVHTWLTDAYPESTPTGTVWLSAFTTKVAVYALARQFAGEDALVWIGAAMASFPIFYAVIENDLRRVLAYSLINQVGFMVCGIGIGTELAVAGSVAHACNDVVFKGLLFMTMGAVLRQTGKVDGSDLGGLWRSMPKTTVLCLVGAASISAFPLFSGFVSKSMIMVAALDQGYDYVWLLLLFASAGVFHHAGIKIPFFAFFAHDSGMRPAEAPRSMLFAMTLAALLCVLVGCVPGLLYGLLPFSFDYHPYDTTHVLTQLQLLLWSALAFVWLQRTGLYPPELKSVNLDADWPLRRAPAAMARCAEWMRPSLQRFDRGLAASRRFAVSSLHTTRDVLTAGGSIDWIMLWVALMLGGVLALYYV